MNHAQPYEEHIITVKGTLRWLAGGGRLILLLALAGALLAGGLQAGKQYKKAQAQKGLPDTIEKEVKVKVDEGEYYNVKSLVEYEEIVKDKQEYLDESILMKTDPMHKWVGSM
ncbi:MAG: hypothetical protein IJ711_07925, partial [Lachnospiraceae bacterium]|nr:hypothetical protein [Lachnospiraceae bacterium]